MNRGRTAGLAGRSVSVQRSAAGAASLLVAVGIFLVLRAPLGTLAAVLAAVGLGGLVFATGVSLACRRYGHSVDCVTGAFCECDRCGRPMDDR